jgi:DNA replication protein DnaC
MRKSDPKRAVVSADPLHERVRRLGLQGALAHWSEIAHEPWLHRLLDWEEEERGRRSLERRISDAKIGGFKAMADFDWAWPTKIDRELVRDLFSLAFIEEGANAVLVGPNGIGKSMMAQNLAHEAVLRGFRVRYTTASGMLSDLSAQDGALALGRRLHHYASPQLLVVDEVGYLSYDARYADLLFEVVTRRYQEHRAIVLTTNKPFAEWNNVFPNAACIVTLIDRLVHRSEIVEVEGESYRLKEAKERAAKKATSRSTKRAK